MEPEISRSKWREFLLEQAKLLSIGLAACLLAPTSWNLGLLSSLLQKAQQAKPLFSVILHLPTHLSSQPAILNINSLKHKEMYCWDSGCIPLESWHLSKLYKHLRHQTRTSLCLDRDHDWRWHICDLFCTIAENTGKKYSANIEMKLSILT